jgi:hypothetical protein
MLYKKIKHEGNHLEWKNPKDAGTVEMDEHHAESLNAQFGNTGIKYEPVGEKSEPPKPTTKKAAAKK